MRTFEPNLPYAQRIRAKIEQLLDPSISDADLAGMVAHYLIALQPLNGGEPGRFIIDHNLKIEEGPKTGACPIPYNEVFRGHVGSQFAHPEVAKPWIIKALCLGYCVSRRFGPVHRTNLATLGTLEDIRTGWKFRERALHPTGRAKDENA